MNQPTQENERQSPCENEQEINHASGAQCVDSEPSEQQATESMDHELGLGNFGKNCCY